MKRIATFFICLYPVFVWEQERTKSIFLERKPGYFETSVLKDNRRFDEEKAEKETVKIFRVDLSGADIPNKVNLYKPVSFYNPPISQGNTGTCWSYSTTSFYESEVFRTTAQKVKISEMFTVYWEYVEKARRYVKERGNSHFDQGSEANAVTRIFQLYGAVPETVYKGLIPGRKHHNHEPMIEEMKNYLQFIKEHDAWDEDNVLKTIQSILNHHMGPPPAEFSHNGKKITPRQYVTDVLKLNMDNYVEILSYKQEPYWQKVEYKVPDNWWHSKDYYNVPLDVFMEALNKSIRNGFSVSIGGDVSEAGLDRGTQVAIVPTFDIPSEYIDEDSRQFRFSNETTTDDHGMHLVGFYTKDNKEWYLVKDSSSGSRNNSEQAPEFGFYFFHEDYVKLKMMGFTVHKDAVKDILGRFK